jgi:hypothetical protein
MNRSYRAMTDRNGCSGGVLHRSTGCASSRYAKKMSERVEKPCASAETHRLAYGAPACGRISGAGSENRTRTPSREPDFESGASTCSAIPAREPSVQQSRVQAIDLCAGSDANAPPRVWRGTPVSWSGATAYHSELRRRLGSLVSRMPRNNDPMVTTPPVRNHLR